MDKLVVRDKVPLNDNGDNMIKSTGIRVGAAVEEKRKGERLTQ